MRLGRNRRCLTLGAWAIYALTSTLLAQTATPSPLRSMREVEEHIRNGLEEMPFELEATVTNWNRVKKKLFVQDEGMALYVALPRSLYEEDALTIKKNSRIRIKGSVVCKVGILRATEVEALGEEVAIKPVDIAIDSLPAGSHWSKLVRFEGEVTTLYTVDNVVRFNIKSSDRDIACFLSEVPAKSEILVGSRVSVIGVMDWLFNSDFVPTNPLCLVSDANDVAVLASAQKLSPTVTIDSVADLHDVDTNSRVEFEGVVSFCEQGKYFYLEDQTGSVLIRDNVSDAMQIGMNLRVEGILKQVGSHAKQLVLQRAVNADFRYGFRDPEEPNVEEVATQQMSGRRIALSGELTQITSIDDRRELTLRSRDVEYEAVYYQSDELFDRLNLEIGQMVHCSGVVSIPSAIGRITKESFRLLISYPDDIRVDPDGIHLDSSQATRWFYGMIASALIGILWLGTLQFQVRRKTKHLAAMTARLNATYEAIDEGILIFGPDNHVLSVNQRFNDLTKTAVTAGDDAAYVLDHLRSRYQAADDFDFFDLETNEQRNSALSSTTAAQQLVASVAPVYEKGKKTANLLTLGDVSQKKSLEAKLIQSQKMEAVGRLAGGVAHDFNNLLMVIRSSVEVAQESQQSAEDRKECLSSASFAVDRAAHLVQNLLDFSRQSESSPTVCSLNAIVDQVHALLRHSFESTIDFDIQLNDDLWPSKIDPTQIEQVLMNLCLNARDALPDHKGRIVITTENHVRADNDFVRLSVTDNGTGMSKDVSERIFEPFFTTKPQGQGTGLGLSMSYGIVHQLGGEIRCTSTQGSGSTLNVLLPRCKDPSPALPTPKANGHTVFSGRVLLVDDDDAVRRCTGRLLSKIGFSLVDVDNGIDALDLAEQKDFDLVFLDLNMPQMSGREVFRRLADLQPDIPVIICSGYLVDRKQFTRETGAEPAAFLTKPFGMQDLQDALRQALTPSNLPTPTASGTA